MPAGGEPVDEQSQIELAGPAPWLALPAETQGHMKRSWLECAYSHLVWHDRRVPFQVFLKNQHCVPPMDT